MNKSGPILGSCALSFLNKGTVGRKFPRELKAFGVSVFLPDQIKSTKTLQALLI